jgi:hypothetical protein
MSWDEQIGVDRDTMMMWSAMPSIPECVIHPSHISLFLFDEADVGALLYKGRKIGKRTRRVCWVLVLLMALVLTLALAWTLLLIG